MKRRDVFIQILHEVSNKPKAEIGKMLDDWLKANPGPNKFDEEISVVEYERVLGGLREQKEGIARWLMSGNLDVLLRFGEPRGRA